MQTRFSVDAKSLVENLKPRESELVPIDQNLVDVVWKDRPARPQNVVHPLDVKYTGRRVLSSLRYSYSGVFSI